MAETIPTERSAFAGLLRSVGAVPAGIAVAERLGLGVASVQARRGIGSGLRDLVREAFAIDLPDGPRRVAGGDVSVLGTAPDAWLAILEGEGNGFAEALAHTLAGLAAVADQSDAYAILRLVGAGVPDTLSKGMVLDLDPGVFRPGDAAVSSASHMSVILWRLPDEPGGEPRYEVAVSRSTAASFWHWLSASAAAFGIRHAPEIAAAR